MLRSLFSAISGLRANQTMLDVTGNNIANANTVGFKSSNVVFQDTLSQMLTGGRCADATAPTRGGTNPMQVGLGVQVGGITTNFNQGSAQVTGRATNLMISGDGFFIVKRGGEEHVHPRRRLQLRRSGNLVTVDGDIVQGYKPMAHQPPPRPTPVASSRITDRRDDTVRRTPTGPDASYNIGADGVITGIYDRGTRSRCSRSPWPTSPTPRVWRRSGTRRSARAPTPGMPQPGGPGDGRRG